MSCRDELARAGALVLAEADMPYSREEIEEIIDLCAALPIAKGIGENNLVQCGRILIDPVDLALAQYPEDRRRVANQAAADRILRVLGKSAALEHWREALGAPRVVIRRAQTNVIHPGGYIGVHTDSESNPEYLANVVLGLTDDYVGGDYVTHRDGVSQVYRLRRGAVLVSLNDIPHEVTPVTAGERRTLAFFLAANEAPAHLRAARPLAAASR
jgi:hypothetical protein